MSTVTGVYPYVGRYPQWFNCVLTLTAPNTRSGELSMTYQDRDRPPGVDIEPPSN